MYPVVPWMTWLVVSELEDFFNSRGRNAKAEALFDIFELDEVSSNLVGELGSVLTQVSVLVYDRTDAYAAWIVSVSLSRPLRESFAEFYQGDQVC